MGRGPENNPSSRFLVQVGSRIDVAGPDNLDKVTARLQRKEPGRTPIVKPLNEVRLKIGGYIPDADFALGHVTTIKNPL